MLRNRNPVVKRSVDGTSERTSVDDVPGQKGSRFGEETNVALRELARSLLAERNWKHVDFVRAMAGTITKGNVSKFFDGKQGLSPPAAMKLAELAGCQLEPLLREGKRLIARPSVRQLPNYEDTRRQLTDETAEVLDAATLALDGIGVDVIDVPLLEAATVLVHAVHAAQRRAKPQRALPKLGADTERLAGRLAQTKAETKKVKDGKD